MARHDRMSVLAAMLETGLVPVFYEADLETACRIAAACAKGGARVLEFTNRGDRAIEVFADLLTYVSENHPDLIVGTGSIVDAPTAAIYIAQGSEFIVGPILNAEVALLCNRRKIAYLPGCGSASEISAAEELGVEIVKIFPGSQVGGPAFVKAIRGPMPWSRIMPTGGVEATRESLEAWFRAGVACVGIGSQLISKELVARGDFETLSRNIERILSWIKEIRAA